MLHTFGRRVASRSHRRSVPLVRGVPHDTVLRLSLGPEKWKGPRVAGRRTCVPQLRLEG